MRNNSSFNIAVIGGGPAGLMAAEVIAAGGARVTVYDGMASLGRKFLLAGRGGLNLTHSEDLDRLMGRYGAAAARLRPAIDAFPPAALRAWCEGLGQPTFIGSSGRVFPKSMKTSPLLRAWLRRLARPASTSSRGIAGPAGTAQAHSRSRRPTDRSRPRPMPRCWLSAAPAGRSSARPATGSISSARPASSVMPLRPANCGFLVPWSETFRSRFAGQPLKRLELSFGARKAQGEALITTTGLEGGGVYALSGPLREAIAASGEAIVHIDLRPELTLDRLEQKLAAPRAKQSVSTFLRKAASLSPAAVGLLHEAAMAASMRVSAMTPAALAQLIKAVPVRLTGTAPLARAISTAGGIALDEVDDRFMLRRLPGVFAAGEMLDWDAPTGGYLLQACFATGAAAGRGALQWLERRPPD